MFQERARWVLRLVTSLLCALALVGLVACEGDDGTTGLLNVMEVSPRQAEVGDRVEVLGTGFPEGRRATLTFVGDLHRPESEPLRDQRITVAAVSTSQTRIGFVLNEAIMRDFCSEGAEVRHTTFHGDVQAAFAPRHAGAPPVTGWVRNVQLDLPGLPAAADVVAARTDAGEKTLKFLGLTLDETATGTAGLTVKEVAKDSRADQADIQAGDVLLEVDGVQLHQVSDLVPSGVLRFARVKLKRGQVDHSLVRRIDVQGLRQAAPKDVAPAVALIAVPLLLLLMLRLPLGRALSWFELYFALHWSERRKQRGRQLLDRFRGRFASEPARQTDASLVRLLSPLSFVGASAVSTLLVYGQHLVKPELDLGLVLLGSFVLQVLTALIVGGRGGRRRWRFLSGLASAGRCALVRLPIVLAFASVVILAGSVRVVDLVGRQGPWPWQWYAFRNPALLIGLVVLLVSSVPDIAIIPAYSARARLGARERRSRLGATVDWIAGLVTAQLVALVLLGGSQLPAWDLAPSTLLALGAVVVQVKAWTVIALVQTVRWVTPGFSINQANHIWWLRVVPWALLGLGGSIAWLLGPRASLLKTAEPLFGYVLFATSALLVLATLFRLRRVVRATPPLRVNPWL